MSAAQLAKQILGHCAREGFPLAGVAPVTTSARADELRAWIAAGKHGGMAWLADTVEERVDPSRLLPGAKSVVMVADFYAPRGTPADPPRIQDSALVRIARYARGRDYHEVMKRRLHRVCDALRQAQPGAATRVFCDSAPVQERELAAMCGLGWQGKHTLLIHPARGSWMVLAGFLTTLELEPAPDQPVSTDHCGTCTRCIDACPTDAITPYSVDASRCISYLTIEHESAIDPELGDKHADWFIGCDICQEVCPHNSARPNAGVTENGGGELAPRRDGFDLLEILGWDEAQRRARFATSAMKRVTLAQAKRNAIQCLVAMVRTGATDAVRARGLLDDVAWDATEDEVVREAARDALCRLAGVKKA